ISCRNYESIKIVIMEPTSMYAQIYIAIQKRIAALVPEIKWIDLDVGQLENYGERPAVQFPCVLIDFPGATYSNLSQGVQLWDGNISTRLGFDPFSNTNHLTPDAVKFKGLEYLEIEQKLYAALSGFTADDNMQPLVRISDATEGRDDKFRVRQTLFTSAAEDETAMLPQNITEALLLIDPEIITT
ncbi:MAG: hypothetical protein ABUT20_48265, partial [Bacteroidota bacterium]